MWWLLIPVLILSTIALISYISGKELKEDIRKDKLTNKNELEDEMEQDTFDPYERGDQTLD